MERRFVLFLVLAFGILLSSSWLMQKMNPRKPAEKKVAAQKAAGNDAKKTPKAEKAEGSEKVEGSEKAEKPKGSEKPKKSTPAVKAVREPELPEQWVTLGSADPNDPYRMLVTLSTKGAALARIELNSPHYCDIDHRYGYLGHLVMAPCPGGKGCPVQVVGPGTPAAEAGLRPGDILKSVAGLPVDDEESLEAVLKKKTKPGRTVELVVEREGKSLTLSAKMRRRPLEVVKPEGDDPLSMLVALQQFDDARIVDLEKEKKEQWAVEDKDKLDESKEAAARLKDARYLALNRLELDDMKLRTANWKIVPSTDKDVAQFRRTFPEKGLEITKTYRLVRVPGESQLDENFPAYDLVFDIEIRNIGGTARKVAYRLDGPNGLPTEGAWYASKVSRNWGGAGLRDFVISFGGGTPGMIAASTVAGDKDLPTWPDTPPDKLMTFIGVDAQYFSAVLMPQRPEGDDSIWFEELTPIRVGQVDPKRLNLTNTSCRLVSAVKELKPDESISHKFKLFAGPKKPSVLEPYRLGELVYYGWFSMVAVPLTYILHFFYAVVHNYGLAIILLTVLVRGCMFPLSLKQAAGAQKMQILQPEIKKLQEKHKNNAEARTKAQQELFRKHNYNPLSGCLPVFIQMPVFIGLYRSLMVAIELRDAPLLSSSIRWCSNLAAPDMLFDWSGYMPDWFNAGVGIFALGPYFNLLPLLTIGLFIMQQKMFMPPAVDEQTRLQQKMMQYMMIFMGLMFFKVASGLCIYFIASSLWGLAERRFLPKTAPAAAAGPQTRADVKAQAREAAAREQAAKEKKEKKK